MLAFVSFVIFVFVVSMAIRSPVPSAFAGSSLRPAVIVFVVALGVRLLHVWAMRDSPFFSVLMGDARGYDTWARQIASGEWIGREVFYQAPLYPYFIGAIYSVFGPDLMTLRIAQALVGSLSCGLVAYAGWRWFSWPVGLVAGLTLALYGPAIFFDFIIQKSVLDVFFVCAALALLGRLSSQQQFRILNSEFRRKSPTFLNSEFSILNLEWVLLGIVIGCLGLTRENALLLVPVIGIWIWSRQPAAGNRQAAVNGRQPATGSRQPARTPGARLPFAIFSTALFALGLVIALAPVAVRNYAVGGGLYLTTSQFGSNFYIGNNPGADGTYMSLRFGRGSPEYERVDATELAERALGRTLTPGEVSSYWTTRALAFITSQPGDWLRLQARKVALLVNATEMVDTESQEAHAEYSWPLRVLLPITHFGVLVPLALVGLAVTWPHRRRLWILYAIGLTYAVSTVMFFVFARYRYPLVPLLVLFAASGAISLVHTRADPRRYPRALIAVVVLVIVITNWPMLSIDRMRAITETNLGTALQEAGRSGEAVERYRKALSVQSDYAPAFNNLGVALRAEGRVDEAIDAYERGLKLHDDYPDLHFNLANALMAQDRAGEAAEHLRRASAVAPGSASVHNNLGKALAEKGQLMDAVAAFERALALEPTSIQALRNLGNVLQDLGRRDEALRYLQRAVEIAPADAEARYDLGSLLLEGGRHADAVRELQAAVAVKPDYVEARNNLGIALASQGALRDAMTQWEEALRIRPDFADARRNLELAKKTAR